MSTPPDLEKPSEPSFGKAPPHHRRRDRLRHFLLPDGRKVHIASSPEEAKALERKLSRHYPDGQFHLYIHGSPEHVEALRQAHSHHEAQREKLREQAPDVYDQFERVHLELDALHSELHMLTEHGVQLEANFSKFGYSAYLRTHDSPNQSSATSLYDDHHDHSHDKKDWEAERRNGTAIKIWQKPVIRQYFHKGLLWRASSSEEVASYELFLDLLYVGIIAINGDKAAEDPTGLGLLRFCITFIPAWRLWTDISLITSWFESNDVVQRVCILFNTACLLAYTTNTVSSFDNTYAQLISFYLASRLFGACYYLWMAYLIPMVRAMMINNAIFVVVPAGIWIASIHVDEPKRQAPIWIALILDTFGNNLVLFVVRSFHKFPPRIGAKIEKWFEFYPAVNIEHKTERTNAFVSLVFGYSVVAILYQNQAAFGVNAFLGKAILGLVQAFCFNWIYFEIDNFNLFVHAIRRHVGSSFLWLSAHLPFIMSFVLSAGALSKLVVAHDCPDADPHTLTELYANKSEGEIGIGLRWFYCCGLGIALAFMGLISISHVHKEVLGQRWSKKHRLTARFVVCIVLICLPLAHHLNSLQLISTTASLIIFVLLIETWGTSCVQDSWFSTRKTDGEKCKYTAECRMKKKDLEEAVRKGVGINIEEVGEKDKLEGMYELS